MSRFSDIPDSQHGKEMMHIYRELLFPSVLDWVMRGESLTPYRCRLVALARGRVLEIGIGSGLNLAFYGEGVAHVIGIDPSPGLLRRAAAYSKRGVVVPPVSLLQGKAEELPIASGVIDTIIMAWTLCSLDDARAALSEMRRVIRPDGELMFVEHGLAPEPNVANWQRRLEPIWTHVSCRLTNRVDRLIEEAGFGLHSLRTGYLGTGPKPMTFMYEGRARPI